MFSLYYYVNLIKLLKHGEYRNYNEFSRFKSVSSKVLKILFTITKKKYHPSLCRKRLLKFDLKKSKFSIICFRFLFTIIKENYDLSW